ncbi:MAG: hypothetical protein U0694_27780 [Anaerolineae bacterium]
MSTSRPRQPLPTACLPACRKEGLHVHAHQRPSGVRRYGARNEKPIFAHLRGDKPEWMSVTTSKEPVGEGNVDLG